MKAIIIRTAILMTFLSIAACGNKGDLFLVEKPVLEPIPETTEELNKPEKK